MTRVLNISFPGDNHAEAVSWALRQLGHDSHIWYAAEFPADQCLSTLISTSGAIQQTVQSQSDIPYFQRGDINRFDVIWHRRIGKPRFSERIHPDDRTFVQLESKTYLDSFRRLSSKETLWVNPFDGLIRAEDKLLQLRTAARLGLTIPETLSSNDPKQIRDFHRRHRGEIIFKPFHSNSWVNADQNKQYSLFATKVPADVLSNDDALMSAPGIYQPIVPKAFEVRSLLIGQSEVSAKILSQENRLTKLDWRADQDALTFERYHLPSPILEKCQSLMREIGISTGSFDFIVSPDGNHTFLEVNQAGQFLFCEIQNPALPMLRAFTAFLAAANPDFIFDEDANGYNLIDFWESPEFDLQSPELAMKSLKQNGTASFVEHA